MGIDGAFTSRVAQYVETSLAHVGSARAVHVPLLFRRQGIEVVRAHLDDAHGWARKALTELDRVDGPAPLGDARRAVAQLLRGVDDARWSPDVARARNDVALTGATERAAAAVRADLPIARMQADPAVTRESLLADVDAILAKADHQIAPEDLQLLANVERLGADKRIAFPGPLRDSRDALALVRRDGVTAPMSEELANLRMWRERARMDADPSTTRESLLARLDAILAKEDHRITQQDLRFVANVDRSRAGADISFPPQATTSTRARIAQRGLVPALHSDAHAEFASLRTWRESARMDADPSVTRESLLARLDAILAKEDHRITQQDLRFVALLDHVDVGRRILLPVPVTTQSRTMLAEQGVPSTNPVVRTELANLRQWVERRRAVETDAGLDAVRGRVRAGDQLDVQVLVSLAGVSDARLERAGLDHAGLLGQALRGLENSGDLPLSDLRGYLKVVDSVVARFAGEGTPDQLVRSARAFVNDNINRTPPEYFQIGRALALARTVVQLQGVTADRAAARELLAW